MRDLFAPILALCAAGFFAAAVYSMLHVPRVHWSWGLDECVRVEPPSAGTCNELPRKYERIWVR